MQIIFSDQPFPHSITKSMFLEGPSMRSSDQKDWKHEALAILENIQYDGAVIIPIPKNKFYGGEDDSEWNYIGQVDKEIQLRNKADIIVAWVAREIDYSRKDLGMPGFTTNVEIGEDLHSGKFIYGRPDSAPKCRYLDHIYLKSHNKEFHTELKSILEDTVEQLGKGALRQEGETDIPLFIWNTPQFQSWYENLKKSGNRLESAKVLSSVKIGQKFVFSYILKVNIWVDIEKRFKSNEFVFARPDISTIVPFYKDKDTNEIYLTLIKEFRSPVNNDMGFVFELPGGSSFKPNVDPKENASHELFEETGIEIEDISRFQYVGKRQLIATLSSHVAYVYSIELTKEEYEQVVEVEKKNSYFGVEEDTERTYIKTIALSQLFTLPLDYSMVGMIYESLKNHQVI